MITVYFEQLLTVEKKLVLIVEMKNDLLKSKELYKSISFSEQEKLLIKPDFYENKNSSWCHFAVNHYFLDENQVVNLSQFIVEKLEGDGLLSIYRKLNEVV